MADYGTLHWSSDGRPFLLDASGSKYFVPPIVAAQYVNDPKALTWAASQGAHIGAPGGTDTVTGAPDASLFKSRGTWNPDTGQYEQGANWDNIASMAVGGFIGAPLVAGALAGGAGAGAGSSLGSAAAAGTGAAGTGGAVAGGVLPSTVIGSGAIGPIAGGASGAVPAAFAAGSSVPASSLIPGVSNSTLVGQGINLFGSLFSAHQQSSAANDAAKIQADAAKYASDAQAKSAADQLAYERQQAAQTQANFEATQKANYGQYASRQRDINALGSLVGAPQRNIPDYVPTTTVGGPQTGSIAGAAQPSTSGPAPTVDWTADPNTLGQQLTAYFSAKGAPATEVPYWVSKAGELVARGKEINNPNYANERLAAADVLGGGAPASARVAATAPMPGSLSAAYLPFQQAPNLTLRGY